MPALRRIAVLASALLPLGLALATPAAASSTANELVYTVDADNDAVYALVRQDLETRKVTTVLPADTEHGYSYDDPDLSPSGRIAVSTDYNGAGADPTASSGIAVVERDGTVKRLTTPPADCTDTDGTLNCAIDTLAAWSPDDDTIVFTRITDTGTSDTTQLFTVKASGGAPVAVPGVTNGFAADFNPKDGTQLVYTALADFTSGVGPLKVVRTDGTSSRDLGVTGALAAWSPDGSTIAYAKITEDDPSTSTDMDVAQIATVPAAGGTETVFATTRPTSARTVAEYPTWMPDGESILYDFYGYSSDGTERPGDLWAVDRFGQRAAKFAGGTGDEAQANAQGPAPRSVTAGTPSRFTATSPRRILDTRSGVGAPKAKVGQQQTLDLQVTGTVPTDGGGTLTVPTNATAVVLNVTVTSTTAITDIRVFPTGSGVPGSSNLNAGRSETVPNLVTATVGTGGKVSIYNSGGTVDLIADIAGWYTPDTAGAGFTSVEPTRILDTRGAPDGPIGVPAAGQVQGGAPIDVQVTGVAGVPADATAVVLNVTGTRPTQLTDVRVYPTPADGTSKPEVSNLNLGKGQTAPNLVTVAIGSGGKVRFANAAGGVDLIADVAGYYSAASAGRYVPVTPLRFLDTRSGIGAAPTAIPNGGFDDLKVAGTRGVPANALAAVLNLTATNVGSLSDVRAYPKRADGSAPVVSNLNPGKGTTRANLAIVKPGDDGRVRLAVRGGPLHLIGDLAGYFV